MASKDDYTSGKVSLSGTTVTGTGTGWKAADARPGDDFIAAGFRAVVKTVDSNTSMTLVDWAGPALTDADYILRFTPDGTRVAARAQNLIELLGSSGNLEAFSGLPGNVDLVPIFTGPGTMSLVDFGQIAGAGLRPRGEWNVATAYAAGDLVSFNARAFASIADGNIGNQPPTADVSDASWMYIPVAPGPKGDQGDAGREVELRKSATQVQWRYVGDVAWIDLVPLDDLRGSDGTDGIDGTDGADGREVELQVTATHIQWRYVGGAWVNLLALADLKGAKGDKGDPGGKGATGDAGPANTLTIGTVAGGASAAATITGTAPNQALNLTLPKGDKGDGGDAATIAVGTVTTVADTAPATVTNVGTSAAAVFNFEIPKGKDGDGAGDMLAATYDPAGKAASAFDMANMSEATDAKVMSAAERAKLDGIEAAADKTTASKVGAAIAGTSQVPSPADGDRFSGVLSGGSSLFWTTFGNIKAALKGYFDGLYATAAQGSKADAALQPEAIGSTIQGYDVATAKLNADQQFTKPQRSSSAALSVVTGSIAWDLAAGNDFTVTLTANAVLAFPAGAATRIGQKGRILISQDATGGRTLATHANLEPLGSTTTPSIPAAANARAYLAYDVIAADRIVYSLTGVGA